ncbi:MULTISPECIES: hypothetical protein [Chryseobacterium]|uniref:Lipoprotein n=2 Tax=Chryseobacterium TaxID=59732 RepID=A0A511YMG2_9FLAO|nr:hypothetical protein [Chryseobacterium hagamense]GEN76392.1 hypothetical protein CHA01nite_21320 [Chryseobacterium hagamense]
MKKLKSKFLFVMLFFIISCVSENMQEANHIINKIEEYRKSNKKLPENLNEIGVKETEEGPVFYKRIGLSNYIIWIQAESSMGDSDIYYSDTKKWEKAYREIKSTK